MWRTVFKRFSVLGLVVMLSGCGAYQRVVDSSQATVRGVFYKQVKTLHLDLSGRSAMNTDLQDMNALSVPTLIRVYQLRERKALEKATYEQLLGDSETVIGADVLDQRAVVVNPEAGAQLNVPLDAQARFVAVVALFRHPQLEARTWRLILERDDLDPDLPRVVELGDNHLSLRPLAE